MTKPFRVGLIGAGGIARNAHVPGWAALAEKGVRVVALADVNAANAEQTAEKVAETSEAPAVYDDYRKLLRRKDLDAVDICTPAAFHCRQSVAALKRGLHVICEKPLCLSRAECRRIARAVKASGKVFMTAQHLRFMGNSAALKKYLGGGTLGEVYYVHCRALRRRSLPARPTFTSKKLSGGGPLLDIGVHILDLAWWLMGGPRVVAVSGATHDKMIARGGRIYNRWGEWDPKETDVEDFACGLVRFENGAVLYLESSFVLNMKEHSIFTATFHGTEAGACWPDCEVFGERSKLITDTRIVNVEKVDAHDAEIAAFYGAARRGRRSPVPVEETAQVIAILEGLYRSAEAGREVRIRQ